MSEVTAEQYILLRDLALHILKCFRIIQNGANVFSISYLTIYGFF